MSMSRKSSIETFVFEKNDVSKPFLADPGNLKADVNLSALADAVRKSFEPLKRWQVASICNYHSTTQPTLTKIVELADDMHAAAKCSLGAIHKAQLLSKKIASVCDLVADGQGSSVQVESLLSQLVQVSDKSFGRTNQAHGQLLCVRAGLSQIVSKIPSQVIQIHEDLLRGPNNHSAPFNGLNATFLMVSASYPTYNIGLAAYKGIGIMAGDSDDEDTVVSNTNTPFISLPSDYLTFQNVIDQLSDTISTMDGLIYHIGKLISWLVRMKSQLERAQCDLPEFVRAISSTSAEQWEAIADQFALALYKSNWVISSYLPTPRWTGTINPWQNSGPYGAPQIPGGGITAPNWASTPAAPTWIGAPSQLARPWTPPPPRCWTPSPVLGQSSLPPPVLTQSNLPNIIIGKTVNDSEEMEKPRSFWQKLSCVS